VNLRSSAWTGRAPRSLAEAFGCSIQDAVHPMPDNTPSLWRRLLLLITGQPDNLETTK
jgi:hypothetical protein